MYNNNNNLIGQIPCSPVIPNTECLTNLCFYLSAHRAAERRQRVVIDKSIQAAQQARGRSERGALAGASASHSCTRTSGIHVPAMPYPHSTPPPFLQPNKRCAR